MAIFETKVMKEILIVTCSILRRNFFYEDKYLSVFVNHFTDEIKQDLELFEAYAESTVIDELHKSRVARTYFTCYFVSAHLREFFLNDLHFTEQELIAFENLLPKYTGEYSYENRPKHSGTYYRKFFE